MLLFTFSLFVLFFQDRVWGKGASRGCKLLLVFILFYWFYFILFLFYFLFFWGFAAAPPPACGDRLYGLCQEPVLLMSTARAFLMGSALASLPPPRAYSVWSGKSRNCIDKTAGPLSCKMASSGVFIYLFICFPIVGCLYPSWLAEIEKKKKKRKNLTLSICVDLIAYGISAYASGAPIGHAFHQVPWLQPDLNTKILSDRAVFIGLQSPGHLTQGVHLVPLAISTCDTLCLSYWLATQCFQNWNSFSFDNIGFELVDLRLALGIVGNF